GAEQRADEDHARVRQRRIALDLLGYFHAQLSFEVDVDDGQVSLRAADEVEGGLAGLEERDFEAELLELVMQKLAEGTRLVGDDRDAAAACRGGRSRPPGARSGRRYTRLQDHLVRAGRTRHA